MAITHALERLPAVTLPPFEALLSQLVALPSVSSPDSSWDQSNEGVVRCLAEWFDCLGFETEIMAIDECPGKVNLIATLGKGSGGLVLAGHTDTVPFDAKKWQQDPFKLTSQQGRFYGLGTCDMKGFFPIIVEALRSMEGAELAEPLIVLATADEESTMSGARALAHSGRRLGRAAVIGEPTSVTPVRMHKGIMMESLSIVGQSGHSSNPALGCNAIEGLHKMLEALLQFRQELQRVHHNPMFEVAFPTLNLGRVAGGDSPNRICGHCELSFDLRPLPGMSSHLLHEKIAARLGELAESLNLRIELRPLIQPVEAFETPENAELVRQCEQFTQREAKAVAFATEASWLQKMGMETLVMGAGSIDQAHQPDEYLAMDQVTSMAQVLRKLITHYCVQNDHKKAG